MPRCRVILMPILLTLFGATVSAQQAAEPQGKFVVVNGHRLWYRIAGQGSPLLLIPGGPGSSHNYFYPQMERLADSFQVIYFDAFGRGQSDRAKNPSEYSFNQRHRRCGRSKKGPWSRPDRRVRSFLWRTRGTGLCPSVSSVTKQAHISQHLSQRRNVAKGCQ